MLRGSKVLGASVRDSDNKGVQWVIWLRPKNFIERLQLPYRINSNPERAISRVYLAL
jgi:hypothetical protein